MKLSRQQMQSLLAGFICMLIFGSSYTYGTLIPFATSYIYYSSDQSITTNKMATLLLISFIITNIGMPISNIQQLQFSNRMSTLISIIGICCSFFALSFGDSFVAYLVCYGVGFNIFNGYGYLAPTKNCYQHIPQYKGLCSGICILGLGISPLLFNFILLRLINPNNQTVHSLDDGRKVYSLQVASNVPFALRIMCTIYLGIGLMGVALMKPPKQSEDTQATTSRQGNESQITETQVNYSLVEASQEITLKELTRHLIRKKILWIVLSLACTIPFGMFVAFNYKEYGMLRIDDDSFLTTIGSFGAIFNGVGRLFWGVMFDKFSYKTISSIINSVLLGTAITMPWMVENQYLYLVIVAVIYFCYGGNYSVYPTHTVRIFGQKLGGKVYFIIFMGFTLGCLIQWLARLLIVPQAKEDKYTGFKTCFYIFAGLNLVSLILSNIIKYDTRLDS